MKSTEFENIQLNYEVRITNSSKRNLCHFYSVLQFRWTAVGYMFRPFMPSSSGSVYNKMCKLFAVMWAWTPRSLFSIAPFPKVCSTYPIGPVTRRSVTSSHGIRDQFTGDPWIRFCNGYFEFDIIWTVHRDIFA